MSSRSTDTASWMILPWRQTLGSAAVFLFAVLMVYRTYYSPPPSMENDRSRWIVGPMALLFALYSAKYVFVGGCTLDFEARQLIRWWGPAFPIWSTKVPFGQIWRVSIIGGKPSKINGQIWYPIIVHVLSTAALVRSFRDVEAATTFGNALAREIGLPLTDLRTPPEEKNEA